MSGQEMMRRWRLILGKAGGVEGEGDGLGRDDTTIDQTLSELYDADRKGSLKNSAPDIARWLGDIRQYFPASVVRVLQQDAIDRLRLRRLLFEPELLEQIEPDVEFVAQLLSLKKLMPAKTRDTARHVVAKVVDELLRKLEAPLRQAVTGSLNRAQRNRRPRHKEINWGRTVHKNLKHYQPAHKTIIPEQLIGYGRRRSSLRDVILCIDQSGSMAASVVYAAIFGAALAKLPALNTRALFFDSGVVDMSGQLGDPVELLFGIQLGGGTDINRAIGYAQSLVERPEDTVLILITDLYEGGDKDSLVKRVRALTVRGVQVIVLLALNDKGAPAYNRKLAARLEALGVTAFACTPDRFPDLMGAALGKRELR